MPTHPKCGKSWTGMRRSHCPSCDETFNSDTAGDMHRVGDWTQENPRRCLTREEMFGRGMVIREGAWLSRADSRPHREP